MQPQKWDIKRHSQHISMFTKCYALSFLKTKNFETTRKKECWNKNFLPLKSWAVAGEG